MEPTSSYDYEPNIPEHDLLPTAMPVGADFASTPTWAQDSYIQIADLLLNFGRQTPVKHIADLLRNGNYRPGDNINPLFSALNQSADGFWRERVVAIWAMGRVRLTAQQRDAAASMLMSILEEKSGQQTVWQRFHRGLRWGYGIALPISLIWSTAVAERTNESWIVIFFQMMLVLGTIASAATVPYQLFYGKGRTAHQDLVRQAAAETLGRLGVMESVGSLAESLFDSSPIVSEASAQALYTLLPLLSDTQYGEFNDQTIRSLGRALTHSDTGLVFHLLGALIKVGTSQAIPYVERVVSKGRTQLLREKALEVQLRLDERKRRGDEASVLMRPSSATTAPTGQLLRPAYHSGETDPLQLLRATDASSNNE